MGSPNGRAAETAAAETAAAETELAETELAETGAAEAELAETTHEFLKALASPTRQQIMLLFARGAELSVGAVADRIGISQSTASQQLTLLRRGRILTCRREGKTVYYRADREGSLTALADLQSYLLTCC